MHVKKDDTVVILTGNDRGKRGRILKVYPDKNRVVVEGVRFMKRHTKPSPKNQSGGIVKKEVVINASNVMVICPSCSTPTRVGRKKITEEGRKNTMRSCAKCSEVF
ncbi:MAG: 50S ribosomal protein L24 [bacterium]